MRTINKKEESTSSTNLERSILRLWVNEEIIGNLNVIFTLVITTIISNFDVFIVLIDDGRSFNIMWHYEGPDIYVVNGIVTHP